MIETVPALFEDRIARSGDQVALRALAAGGAARDAAWRWKEWGEASRRFAAALVAGGHVPGSSVAVLAGNRPEWPIADLGIITAGLVSVGVYPTSAAAQVQRILADCRAEVVVVDTVEQLEKVLAIGGALPSLRTVVAADGVAAGMPGSVGSDAASGATGGSGASGLGATGEASGVLDVVSWTAWLERGARALASDIGVGEELAARSARARPEDVALLIYTSGSTGEPKGAEISHRYVVASARSVREVLGLDDTDTTLSFLPYCHAGERIFGLYTRILCGVETGLVEDHRRIWEAARSYGPTLFGGLPRFYEKVHEALEAERAAATGEMRACWDAVLDLGRRRSRLRRSGAVVPEALETEWCTLGAPLFQRVRDRFGGRLRLATSGGAALPPATAEFLDALGVTVLGAYGLTEHLCVAFNRPDDYTFDAVGPCMPGTEVRIADDGEILVRRGALTFSGYRGREAETREAFTEDGAWLRTGDLGALDARGILRVTGRKKELIALSGGKKVAPLPIEARLSEDPWIAQAVLQGEGRRFITALVALRRPVVEAWARERGLDPERTSLARHPEVLARVQAAVDRVNADLSNPERIRRFVVLERELSEAAGELTPTMKVRRAVVAQRYAALLDPLYR